MNLNTSKGSYATRLKILRRLLLLLVAVWIVNSISEAKFPREIQLGDRHETVGWLMDKGLLRPLWDGGSAIRILTFHFIHDSFSQLLANCAGLGLLGFLLNKCDGHLPLATLGAMLGSGLFAWLFQLSGSYTVGASAIVCGWWVYLMVIWWKKKGLLGVVFTGAMVILIGGMIQAILPGDRGTSGINWQAHLGGAVGGGLTAWWTKEEQPDYPFDLMGRLTEVSPLTVAGVSVLCLILSNSNEPSVLAQKSTKAPFTEPVTRETPNAHPTYAIAPEVEVEPPAVVEPKESPNYPMEEPDAKLPPPLQPFLSQQQPPPIRAKRIDELAPIFKTPQAEVIPTTTLEYELLGPALPPPYSEGHPIQAIRPTKKEKKGPVKRIINGFGQVGNIMKLRKQQRKRSS